MEIIDLGMPGSRSHSQMRTWLECPKKFQLGHELRVPGRPGVWFPAGAACHAVIEKYLLEKVTGSD